MLYEENVNKNSKAFCKCINQNRKEECTLNMPWSVSSAGSTGSIIEKIIEAGNDYV